MAVERAAGGSSLIDVLDRVLDKGIVIDAWVRVSLVGIDLITVEARVVVASIDTYLKYSEAVGQSVPVARPALESRSVRRACGGESGAARRVEQRGRRAPAGRAASASGSVAFHGEKNDEDERAARREAARAAGSKVAAKAPREKAAARRADEAQAAAIRHAANTCTASSSRPIR